MALPTRAYRGDIVVMVATNTTAPYTYAALCGATSVTLTISNEITSERVADCQDWTLPPQTIKGYGAQNVTATVNGIWARENHERMLNWAASQEKLPVRFSFANVGAGETQYIDGIAMLSEFGLDNIGNVDGNAVARTISLEFDGSPTFTKRP
jgi:hypothetical protein